MPATTASTKTPQALLDAIRRHVSRKQYDLWFATLSLASIGEHEVALLVADSFTRDWLTMYYRDVLERAVHEALGPEVSFEIGVADAPDGPSPEPRQAPVLERAVSPAQANHSFYLDNSDVVLNPKYTFENFVVGPSNQLAHAAALAVADAPAGSYNPLFLHGAVGLGKTHLLQAICQQALCSSRKMNVLYLSSETFVNQFISAIEHGELDRFRYKYRKVDILLIDDIHLIANKERTQEEFFHTFNALFNAGRQIVLSSDSPPAEIPTLKERLISRFKWGLVAELAAPSYETRLGILRRKARNRAALVPEEVLSFLAETVDTNIRELEGAITKVLGFADLIHRDITLELAHQALGQASGDSMRLATGTDRILDVVCKQFSVRVSDLQGRKRTQSIALPRQVAMYLARKLTPLSLEEIGGHFGGRDHSTVLYAVEKIRRRAAGDRDFGQMVNGLEFRARC